MSLNYEPDLILWFSYKINVEKRGVRMNRKEKWEIMFIIKVNPAD